MTSPDIKRFPDHMIPKVTKRLGELAQSAVISQQKAEADKEALLDHLRNLKGQTIPVRALARQVSRGSGFEPFGSADKEGKRGGWVAPDYYEVGEVQDWGELGSQVALRRGDWIFTVDPISINAVEGSDILAHRTQVDEAVYQPPDDVT